MNFIELESKQKLRGGFYTERPIADFLVRWVEKCRPEVVLEPSCGDGVFLESIEEHRLNRLARVCICEIDSEEAEKAKTRTHLPIEFLAEDFLRWYLLKGRNRVASFDAVVGNPPFIRYQYLPKQQQLLAEKIFDLLNLTFTKHINAWVPFVVAALNLLRPGGRLAMVVPSEIFHIPHAQSLRCYLVEQCSRILLLDPRELWFTDTLQGIVLLMAEKKTDCARKSLGVAVLSAARKSILADNPEQYFQEASYTNGETILGKWMPVFLTEKERALLSSCRGLSSVKPFSQVASVDVGIVTGANKFFLVADDVVEEFELHKWAQPMFGRSEHVAGLIYTSFDHEVNKKGGLPTNFLWFRERDLVSPSKKVERYLASGLDQRLHMRFKCRTRKCWYEVPSVYRTPIAMLKRAHNFPRLILNSAKVLTTDTAYRIRSTNMKAERLVFNFVNSLTCLTAELEGRHYGGGVLELVPSEIERLLIPSGEGKMSLLRAADRRFRELEDEVDFVREQDSFVLTNIGMTPTDQDSLYGAWLRLRNRRQRIKK